MNENDLTIERVVATVRERGAMANRELCAALGVAGRDPSRTLDRLLQKARGAGLLRFSGGCWVAADVETADEKIARLERERDDLSAVVDAATADRAQARQERDSARAALRECHVLLDGAQADRAAARRERDEALNAALVDHSALESERARLAHEVEQLQRDLSQSTSANSVLARDHAFMREERRQAMELCAVRSNDAATLQSQLTALAAEHESAARAAEERVARLAGALTEARDEMQGLIDHAGDCGDPDNECALHDAHKDWSTAGVVKRCNAALAEVKPQSAPELAERDTPKAQFARLADALHAAALYVGHRVSCAVHADPMAACDCGYGAVWERYAAVLVEVRP